MGKFVSGYFQTSSFHTVLLASSSSSCAPLYLHHLPPARVLPLLFLFFGVYPPQLVVDQVSLLERQVSPPALGCATAGRSGQSPEVVQVQDAVVRLFLVGGHLGDLSAHDPSVRDGSGAILGASSLCAQEEDSPWSSFRATGVQVLVPVRVPPPPLCQDGQHVAHTGAGATDLSLSDLDLG